MPVQPTLFGTPSQPGIDFDEAVGALASADPKLALAIQQVGRPVLSPPTLSPFAYLLRAITYQQLSTRAAGTIHGRVLDLFPGRRPTPERLRRLSHEALRGAGLSEAKARSVRDLAHHSLSGTVPTASRLRSMENEEVIDHLTQVRGVGRWTVEMLLIFYLGRPDVLPLADLGIRKGFAKVVGRVRKRDAYGLPHPDIIERRARRWKPYRSIASIYLWRILD